MTPTQTTTHGLLALNKRLEAQHVKTLVPQATDVSSRPSPPRTTNRPARRAPSEARCRATTKSGLRHAARPAAHCSLGRVAGVPERDRRGRCSCFGGTAAAPRARSSSIRRDSSGWICRQYCLCARTGGRRPRPQVWLAAGPLRRTGSAPSPARERVDRIHVALVRRPMSSQDAARSADAAPGSDRCSRRARSARTADELVQAHERLRLVRVTRGQRDGVPQTGEPP